MQFEMNKFLEIWILEMVWILYCLHGSSTCALVSCLCCFSAQFIIEILFLFFLTKYRFTAILQAFPVSILVQMNYLHRHRFTSNNIILHFNIVRTKFADRL